MQINVYLHAETKSRRRTNRLKLFTLFWLGDSVLKERFTCLFMLTASTSMLTFVQSRYAL